MRKIIALLLVPTLAFGATENMSVDSLDGKVRLTPQGVGSVSKPFDFTDVNVLGIGGGGGGGTPGGSNLELQWNNSFTFGGVPYLKFNGTMVSQTAGARYQLVDPTDITKRVQLSISGVTGLKTVSIFDNSVTVTPSASATLNQFVTHINTSGVPQTSQPTFLNISGNFTLAQSPSTPTNTLIGRYAASSGIWQNITIGANLTLDPVTGVLDATGGSVTPGGSAFQFQWNDAGTALNGVTSLVTDGVNNIFATSTRFFLQDPIDATKLVHIDTNPLLSGSNVSVKVHGNSSVPIATGVTANQFLTSFSGTTGLFGKAQPAFTDISGVATLAQQNIPVGKERFVDLTNGVDATGAANLARPYLTIQEAFNDSSAGDVVYLYPGTYDQAGTPLVIPAGVYLVGAGPDNTLITSTVAKATNRRSVEPSTASSMANLTVQNTNASGAPFGNGSSSAAFTSAYVSSCKFISNSDGILIGKTGTTGLVMEDSVITSQSTGIASSVGSHTYRGCSIIVDGTAVAAAKGMDLSGGVTLVYRDGTITAGNASTSNIVADTSGSGTTLELHNVSLVRTGTASTANLDLKQATSSAVGVDAVTSPDATALETSGTITQLSRYAVRDQGLKDYTNLASPTRGDIIYYNGTDYVKLPAGIDGNVLTTHGTTADPEWVTGPGSAAISDTAYGVIWSGATTTAPSQNAAYNYLHLFDTDDDGKINVLDQVAGIANTDASGVIQTPLTAPSGAIVGTTDTQTLTNKRITKRTESASAPGATKDIATDTYDVEHVTGLNAPITISTSGTPQPPDTLRIDLTDDGTARALSWDLSDFEASPGQELPATTTSGVRLDIGFVRNSATGRWRCVASSNASAGGGGSGTVTSVGLTGTNGITVTGTSPIVSSGTFALSLPITLAGTAGKTLTASNTLTLAGTDGSTLNVGAGGTLGSNAFTSTAFLTSANISDAVWGSAWDTVTTIAPSKNAIYDWGHTFDTDDDGLPNKVDVTGPGLLSVDASNVLSLATGGTDYADLTFKTIVVSGQSNVVADSAADQLTYVAGTGMTITTTPGTDTVTFASSGGGGTAPTGTGFYHVTSGVMDGAAIAETGTGSVVRNANPLITKLAVQQSANGSGEFVLYGSRFTDTAPTGHLMWFQNTAANVDLWDVDVTGTLNAGIIPWARLTSTPTTLAGYGIADAQPLDSDLTTIAGLTATTGNIMMGFGSAWASRTGAQFKTALTMVTGVDLQAWDADLDTWATKTAPSGTVIGTTDTQTLTNKRINPRASGGCDETSSATSTPDSDACDQWSITALAAADAFVAPTGTPVNGQNLTIRIKDNGTARALSFATGSSGQYRFSSDMAAPTTTVLSKTMYLGFKWNAADSRWDNVAQINNF